MSARRPPPAWWCVAATLAAGCAAPLSLPPPEDLPDEVLFRSATESFNSRWSVAVRDGRIWVKPRQDADGEWELLGDTGLPAGRGVKRFAPPQQIAEISADGCHLIALSEQGVYYRGTDLRRDVHRAFHWTDRWGHPAARGPGLTAAWPSGALWDVSDAHPFDVDHYEDRLGREHSVGMGVAHLYAVGPDGTDLRYNDWWLPADWSRRVCGPERGTTPIAALSASASTLMVLSDEGEVFTRLWDYDTSCENSLLTCSYRDEIERDEVRALPAEDWRRQPPLPDGRLTGRIAIYQHGEGNAARGLRVEALRDQGSGYWAKELLDPEWSWMAAESGWEGPTLEQRPARRPVAGADQRMVGTLSRDGEEAALEVIAEDLNPICSPARLTLWYQGDQVAAGGAPLVLALHHVDGEALVTRPSEDLSEPKWLRGALLWEQRLEDVDGEQARAAVAAVLGDHALVTLHGEGGPDGVALDEVPRGTPFLFPRADKGAAGQSIHLRLAPL
ncbi:MAG: hypothetical protein JXX28_10580 [Deltaproteobacteria bacterium]|nr:hypothetical protein [Deltaproteobacteria bacterium]